MAGIFHNERVIIVTKNCSEMPPFSNEYLNGVTVIEKVFIGLVTALCVAIIMLFVDKVHFIVNNCDSGHQARLVKERSLVLVGIYPVVSVSSVLAIYVPRSKLFCDFVSTVFIAVCLHQFTSLIVLYFGGKTKLIQKTRLTGFNLQTPPCCCLCCCCPVVKATVTNLRRLQVLVMQTTLLQPVLSFISVVIWLDGKYTTDVPKLQDSIREATLRSPGTYLSLIRIISTLVAMWGLLILFRSTRQTLDPHSITAKFAVLQLVLIFHNLQPVIFGMLAEFGIPACLGSIGSSVRADAINHMMLIAEVFVLSCVARLVYQSPVLKESNTGYVSTDDFFGYMSDGSFGIMQDFGHNSMETVDPMLLTDIIRPQIMAYTGDNHPTSEQGVPANGTCHQEPVENGLHCGPPLPLPVVADCAT